MDGEGADHRSRLYEILEDMVHSRKLIPRVAFRILFRFPEADPYDAVRLRVGYEHRFVQEPSDSIDCGNRNRAEKDYPRAARRRLH